MTASEFLSTLTNKDAEVTLVDNDTEEVVVSLKAGGYASLDDTLESRAIKKWTVKNSSEITAVLGDAVTTEPSSDPSDPSDP